jgi:hypothetical protein
VPLSDDQNKGTVFELGISQPVFLFDSFSSIWFRSWAVLSALLEIFELLFLLSLPVVEVLE